MESQTLGQPDLNQNITRLKESATLAINMKARAMRARGEDVVHFGFGQSPFPVPPPILQALIDNAHQKDYLPTLGLRELREAFCKYYKECIGYSFSPDRVCIGPGSKELIFQALLILEGPLIIPAPSWVSYGPQAHIRGKHVHTVITSRESGYKLTPELMEQACSSLSLCPQKILILNHPNNPTGAVYSRSELKELAVVFRKYGVIVISDEIYAGVHFHDTPFVGLSEEYPESTIVTSGLSKTFSAGGYRLGMLAVPDRMKDLIQTLAALISETFSAVSAPTQYAAMAAFEDTSPQSEVEDYVSRCTRIHHAAGDYLYKKFKKIGLGGPAPEGAFYFFPDFLNFREPLARHGIHTSTQLCQALLNEAGVATLPSLDFYMPDSYLACRVATVDYDGAEVYKAAEEMEKRQGIGVLGDAFIEAHCPHLKAGCEKVEAFLKSKSV